ncbi:DUF262 domain-containing protein [Coraliomargarita sp. SDUM461004]|uniref:DUF262 domain-containing protein n=1 Tax=Thalassobacterium sedimentorum TaxID=3041258 RepID=A0ABU1AGX8_9BACT|nr:DUF262 domain-containing protein [Coraliomargarita sp. SDUM461004]MDQ8194041.1 DUF262 domain-containing protein [Coraliomargarita sp. SDUM461004]
MCHQQEVKEDAHVVALPTLASWYLPEISELESEIRVSIPRLQRGLVWKPAQVELLWDSILRGFPIGSLVISNAIEDQNKDANERARYQLLDGQQRSNAIALGFRIPNFHTYDKQDASILWMDLAPKERGSHSTRHFWTRLTKIAHPWGYRDNDACSILSAGEIRDALIPYEAKIAADTTEACRPTPSQLSPYKANCPIPMGLLMEAAKHETLSEGLAYLTGQLSALSHTHWAGAVAELLRGEFADVQFPEIFKVFQRVRRAKVVLLKAPDELIGKSGEQDEDDILNLELLFQRLNTQGTVLSGEELSYSMIKAYFPEVVDTVDEIKPLRMQPSRIVNLGVRAALTTSESERLHGDISIVRLRALMKETDGSNSEYKVIHEYCTDLTRLPAYCQMIDSWLCYDEQGSNKLPNYIVSNIAGGSRDIYLLLLCWAEQLDGQSMSSEVEMVIPGLVTLLRWFSIKLDHCCNILHKHTRHGVTIERIQQGVQEAINEKHLILLRCPGDTTEFIAPFDSGAIEGEAFKSWGWWHSLITKGEEPAAYVDRESQWHHFLERIKGQKELLLYCQRDYLWKRFKHYDQSNAALWEDHNRPWDYDHILARNCVVGKHRGGAPFKDVCGQWINTIGNFWACPFEDNRAYGDGDVSEKVTEDFLTNSFMEKADLAGFSRGHDTTRKDHEDFARDFCNSARSRMINIYTEWYQTAQIGVILETSYRG